MNLVDASRDLVRKLASLRFGPPVTHVYNPLAYARIPHEAYLAAYGTGRGRIVLLGMNPGPWGMAQTGVPFGHTGMVRDWLRIEGRVDKPEKEHPKRPVEGFACPRGEVSGERLWGWARDAFSTPEAFFARFFVVNYCPLCFLEASGRNRTPDKLSRAEREALLAVCDEGLRRVVEILAPARIVGVGAFAEASARRALEGTGLAMGKILHPSPASPAANRGWAEQVTAQLRAMGVEVPPRVRA